ncbi:MAG: hypothetical protein ABH879_05610 [archaeon]
MFTEPESMDEIVYFTRRAIGDGCAVSWVYRQECPVCKAAKMGKPVVKGKVKIRSDEYVCPACGHTVEKKEYEESLNAQINYTCPECRKEGSSEVPFKRKSIKGVQTLRCQCEHCGANIDITKKMKGMS